MNGLNCESKNKSFKRIISYAVVSIISVLLTVAVCAVLLFQIPGIKDLLALNSIVQSVFYGEIENTQISAGILSGYMEALDDKYSHFLNADNTAERDERLDGISSGFGMYVTKNGDSEEIYITQIFPNSPAEQAGLLKGDVITHIAKNGLSESEYSKSIELLQCDIGESVEITVRRNEENFDVSITNSKITLSSVFYEKINELAYIEILTFNNVTPEQFKDTVNTALNDNVKGIIFDLRNNGGGTLDSVAEMLDFILPEGDLVTAKYKNGKTKVIAESDENEINIPMAVLVNENTASAAEIFASNVKEFNKGILIGEKTYGKGVMQNTYRLSKGSSVVITVAEVFTHNMTEYNNIGIIPDIQIELTDAEKKNQLIIPTGEDRAVMAAVDKLSGDFYAE